MRRLVQGWRGRAVSTIVAGAGLCAVLALPGAAMASAAASASGDSDPYVYAKQAQKVRGAQNSTDAPRLSTGATYRSSLGTGADGAAYYSVELDGAANAYVSAVAVPPLGPDVKVTYADGITVSLQDRNGNSCDSASATFRSGAYPRPVAAAAQRLVRPGGLRCQAAGTYYVVVQRKADNESTQETWGLELQVATEPGLVAAAPTEGPEAWPSQSVQPPSGKAALRTGGTGFNDAEAVPAGVWKDGIRPGQSRFYRVPVDWGQQLSVDAELGSSASDVSRRGFVTGALDMALYNPARASVAAKEAAYSGDPTSVTFDPLPPVAYENRYLMRDDQAAMRLAGWYYLKVTLNPAMAGKFGDKASGVTLRVTVDGTARQAPDYVRDPGEFQVTAADREAAERGEGGAVWSQGAGSDGDGSGGEGGSASGGSAGTSSGKEGTAEPGASSTSATSLPAASSRSTGSGGMMLLGVAGVGAGTALVLWLGVWRMVALRRVRG
ncbi:hypothetical protein G3I40_31525 [Streptomyces sp. SID14478]|uniref:hypothetical protein n=1 Tax=Streptomyces sp. SID14478 TaxID=2706073 RepID=UPI0013DB0E1E|nr:hypothetical protein [Streptomyces sp. SID14478]NEB79715.1 hypothetical protein [Streptomyces sp. SID14478]